MKISFKVIGVSAVALALVFSGCNKKSKSESTSKSESKSESGSESDGGRGGGPADSITGAMTDADLATTRMNGRKLMLGIIQANVERESAGLGPVWPRTWRESDTDGDDIAQKSFKTAADYFSVLFDMEHYGTSEWDPIVEGDLLSTLGKNAVDGKKINPAGLDWCIAANVLDETFDFMPVLVSANVNPARLPCNRFSGRDDRQLPIGRKAGAARSMFDDREVVLVRKSGAAERIKKGDFTLEAVFQRQGFDNSARKIRIAWLTPTGIAEAE